MNEVDPYAFDIAGLRQEIGHAFAAQSPNGQARVSGVTDEPYRPPLVHRLRSWPGWLCWLLGHEPVIPTSLARDDRRCLCGAAIVSPVELYRRRGHRLYGPWPRFVDWLWRVLP